MIKTIPNLVIKPKRKETSTVQSIRTIQTTQSVRSVFLTKKKIITASSIGSQRLPHFIRCGKKSQSEGRLHNLFVRRSIARRTSLAKFKSSNIEATPFLTGRTCSPLFFAYFRVATPFVALKIRRRGKRIVHKIAPILPNRGERKSFTSLAKTLHTAGAVSKPFGERFERELELLAISVSSRNSKKGVESGVGSVSGTAASQMREKRDTMHRQAYQARPYRWGRKRITNVSTKQEKTVKRPLKTLFRKQKKLSLFFRYNHFPQQFFHL